jgi:hypothetical protein
VWAAFSLMVTQVVYAPEGPNTRPSWTSELFKSTLSSNVRQCAPLGQRLISNHGKQPM